MTLSRPRSSACPSPPRWRVRIPTRGARRRRSQHHLLSDLLAIVFASVALAACGDKADEATVPDLPTASPTSAARAPTPQPSPLPSPTANPETERTAVVDAAVAALGGARYISPLTLQACLEGNPERKPCIELKTAPAQLARGVARFTLGDPDGGASIFLMGRTANGRWAYWRGSQQQSYVLEMLPGQLLACGGTAEAVIRTEPSVASAVLATPPNLAPLTAEQLRLTMPGEYGVSGKRGEAWYRLLSPALGWIDATQTTAASLGDCLLHDEVEHSDRG